MRSTDSRKRRSDGDRRLQHDLPVGQFLDLQVQRVDDLVALDQLPHASLSPLSSASVAPGRSSATIANSSMTLASMRLQIALEFLPVLAHGQKPTGEP